MAQHPQNRRRSGPGSQAGRRRPAKLSAAQKEELAQALTQGAKAAGFESELWTGPRITQLIRERFGVSYNDHYVLELLRGLNFTPQRPQPVADKKNKKAKQKWLEEDWPKIKKRAAAWAPGSFFSMKPACS